MIYSPQYEKKAVHNTCNISINNEKTNVRDIYAPLCNSYYRVRFSGTKRRACGQNARGRRPIMTFGFPVENVKHVRVGRVSPPPPTNPVYTCIRLHGSERFSIFSRPADPGRFGRKYHVKTTIVTRFRAFIVVQRKTYGCVLGVCRRRYALNEPDLGFIRDVSPVRRQRAPHV